MSTILLNDTAIDASQAPAHQSLLDFVRGTGRLTGTKEGCASGDCGACTLIVRETDGTDPINVNSCITPVGAAISKQVITVEGVGTPDQMHPVQQAMVDHHGSQCGFCTPGFVMSLVAAQLRSGSQAPDKESAITSISGNLCRCTGYRPIIDAALAATTAPTAAAALESAPLSASVDAANTSYTRPKKLKDVLAQLKAQGAQRRLGTAQAPAPWLLAGATDAFLEVSQQYLDPVSILDLSEVSELIGFASNKEGGLTIGAATTHADALEFFSQPTSKSTAITDVLNRFGSPQIRNRGTLGGNIANASPIADWPPLLIALNASVTLVNAGGKERHVPLDTFYLGYKSTQLADDELIKDIQIPAGTEFSALHAHKISKRFEDDISSALGAIYLRLKDGSVSDCRIAYGGVGPVPMRCANTEEILLGQTLNKERIETAVAALASDITPISDVRASENYRRKACQAVLREALVNALNSTRRGDE